MVKKGRIIGVYDAGDKVADRYTVVFDETAGFARVNGKLQVLHQCLYLSPDCDMPNGVNMWGECVVGKHLGRKIKVSKLPKRVRSCVARSR